MTLETYSRGCDVDRDVSGIQAASDYLTLCPRQLRYSGAASVEVRTVSFRYSCATWYARSLVGKDWVEVMMPQET